MASNADDCHPVIQPPSAPAYPQLSSSGHLAESGIVDDRPRLPPREGVEQKPLSESPAKSKQVSVVSSKAVLQKTPKGTHNPQARAAAQAASTTVQRSKPHKSKSSKSGKVIRGVRNFFDQPMGPYPHANQFIDDGRETIPKLERHLDRTKKTLDQEQQRLISAEGEIHRLQAVEAQLQADLHQHKQLLLKANNHLTELSASLDAEKAKVRKAEEESDQIKLSASQLQAKMESKELFVGVQATDDEITKQFTSLVAAIKTWATKFSNHSVTVETSHFNAELISQYRAVVPHCTGLSDLEGLVSDDKNIRRFFIRGWTAYVISDSILAGYGSTNFWMGQSMGLSFTSLEERFIQSANETSKIAARAFYDWRSLTADLASRVDLNEEEDQHVSAVLKAEAERIWNLVWPWAKPQQEPNIRAGLLDLLQNALDLSVLLKKQRASWSVRFPSVTTDSEGQLEDLAFNPNTMKDVKDSDEGLDVEELRKCRIKLVLAPALHKRGNSDGEHYDVSFPAAKALVLLGN